MEFASKEHLLTYSPVGEPTKLQRVQEINKTSGSISDPHRSNNTFGRVSSSGLKGADDIN